METKFKLSRSYKNLFIYSFVENFGNTLNFSVIDHCYIEIPVPEEVDTGIIIETRKFLFIKNTNTIL